MLNGVKFAIGVGGLGLLVIAAVYIEVRKSDPQRVAERRRQAELEASATRIRKFGTVHLRLDEDLGVRYEQGITTPSIFGNAVVASVNDPLERQKNADCLFTRGSANSWKCGDLLEIATDMRHNIIFLRMASPLTGSIQDVSIGDYPHDAGIVATEKTKPHTDSFSLLPSGFKWSTDHGIPQIYQYEAFWDLDEAGRIKRISAGNKRFDFVREVLVTRP